jgi:hypothetical protein
MKKVVLFALALVTLLVACHKDVATSFLPTTQGLMTVEKAKTWFDKVEPQTVWTGTEKQEHYKPQWDKAIQLNGAIEVPVMLEDKIITPSANPDNPKQFGASRLLVASFDGKNIYGAIIKYLPSTKFAGNIADINRDNFREKHFDGMIELENFDFTDQKVVLIENGELTYFMAQSSGFDNVKRDYQVCFQTCTSQRVSVPSQGYYGPTTWSCAGTYCIIVPTSGFSFNDPNRGQAQTGQGASSGGMNNLGVGILAGTPISPDKQLCKESILPANEVPPAVGDPNDPTIPTVPTYQTGLTEVNISLDKREQDGGQFKFSFDYMQFVSVQGNYNRNDIPSIIAKAFERAINSVESKIQLGGIGGNPVTITTDDQAKFAFRVELNSYLRAGFGNNGSGFFEHSSNPNSNVARVDRYGGASIPIGKVKTKDRGASDATCR